MLDSSLVTYCATCSSVSPRSSVSFNFFMSSEARSTGGTLTSVTRKPIPSVEAAPSSLLDLLDDCRRLGLQSAGDLIVAPSRLDLVLDLVKVAFTRRGDPQNVVPDIAARERNRIVVDAHAAVKGLRADVETARNVRHRLAIGKATGAVDSVDGDGGKPQFLRGLDYT